MYICEKMLLLLYPNDVNLQLAHHKNMLLYTFYNIYMYMIWIMSFTKHAFYIWTFFFGFVQNIYLLLPSNH